MQEVQIRSLGQEDPLVKEMAMHSIFLGWDAHDWEYHLCFCLGPNPWWLGGKKKKKKIHLLWGR